MCKEISTFAETFHPFFQNVYMYHADVGVVFAGVLDFTDAENAILIERMRRKVLIDSSVMLCNRFDGLLLRRGKVNPSSVGVGEEDATASQDSECSASVPVVPAPDIEEIRSHGASMAPRCVTRTLDPSMSIVIRLKIVD